MCNLILYEQEFVTEVLVQSDFVYRTQAPEARL